MADTRFKELEAAEEELAVSKREIREVTLPKEKRRNQPIRLKLHQTLTG